MRVLGPSRARPEGTGLNLRHHWRFIRGYVRDPSVVGSVAPSSRALASALCAPYHRETRRACVLEVGAGTGAVTRHLGSILRDGDELDVCEMQPDFAEILRRDVLTRSDFAPAVSDGRVRLLQSAVQDITEENRYDFIISGLPFTSFGLGDVQSIFDVVRRSLKPGGVFSYFEYFGFRKTSSAIALGKSRARVRSVSRFLTQTIRDHQFATRIVVRNVPPALTRYLRFTKPPAQTETARMPPRTSAPEVPRYRGVSGNRSATTRSS